mgnify:CR=1 FL=1
MRPLLTLLVPLAAIGCTADKQAAAPAQPAAPAVAAAGAVDCLDIQRIRESRVVDDQTIDFVMRGGETYRSALPNKCPTLGFERAFSYNTSLSKLCTTDIITVVNTGGGPVRGPSCGLGKFVPYTPPAKTPA